MKKEIKSLTGLRGFAALWVIFYHIFMISEGDLIRHLKNHEFVIYFFRKILSKGYLAVDLFFLLSAFVMCLSYEKKFKEKVTKKEYKSFLLKRIIRVYPLYLVMTIVFFIFHNPNNITIIPFIANLSFTQLFNLNWIINPVTWSLCAEFFIYLVFPTIFLYRKEKLYLSLGLLILFSLLLISVLKIDLPIQLTGFSKISMKRSLDFFVGVPALFRAMADYIIGISLFLLKDKIRIPKSFLYLLLILLVLIPFGVTDPFTIFLFGLLIIHLYQNDDIIFGNKIIYFLGLISYSMYICQNLFIKTWGGMYALTHGFIFIIPVSIILYYFIEKPFSEKLKQIIFRNK